MDRPLIAIITGISSCYAEKELLHGIIAENRKNGYDTVVFSAIYNIVHEDAYLECEKRIFELVYSQDVSGVILFCESFVDERSRSDIAALLQKLTVPLVGIGSELPEFDCLSYPRLDTNDVCEIEELTDHLIDVHGFTDILMLTGMAEVDVSHERVEGYKNSLTKHGIGFDPDKVIFGDFWMTSGEALADSIIRGERDFPQAVICANDRMAYGLLRRFSDAGIKVPEQITVIAYEYSDYRLYYSPLLTCMKRDRESLGAAAARTLHCMIAGEPVPEFVPPMGNMVYGSSCSCHADEKYFQEEQRYASERLNDYELNLFCTMEHRMTLCRDMKELIGIIGDFQWMIRNKRSMYLRLYADWYDLNSVSESLMQSRCIVPYEDNSVFEHDRFDLKCLFEREPEAVVCYYAPVFFGNNLFGDMAVMYDKPDGYDNVFRHWLKSVSIGLEYMRLKNDFHYLLSCQSVSEYRDSLTGLYNEKGLKRAFSAHAKQNAPALCCVMMKLLLHTHPVSEEDISRKTKVMTAAAKAVRCFCGEPVMAGHTADDTFVCFVPPRASAEQLADLLSALVLSEKDYINCAGSDSFACAAVVCCTESYSDVTERCGKQLNISFERLQLSRSDPSYHELTELRDQIYSSPEITFAQDNELLPEARLDHYRGRYKKCFGITFHQDCIAARITRAKYYLATTQLDLAEISEKCGYFDHKYFQRQFASSAGMPALKYRALLGR
ncbi:MAG: substrate-binding domain-containing protein [Ruminococcus sp.]|nr:substrate-binding domain-containing protein [Ruminococcus sp.]